ncbi:unnamed protein product [Ectocarpus fasciculatus]
MTPTYLFWPPGHTPAAGISFPFPNRKSPRKNKHRRVCTKSLRGRPAVIAVRLLSCGHPRKIQRTLAATCWCCFPSAFLADNIGYLFHYSRSGFQLSLQASPSNFSYNLFRLFNIDHPLP